MFSTLYKINLVPAETGHAPIQPYDSTGASHGAPRVRQQSRVSARYARCDGSISEEARPAADPASPAAESQPAVSWTPHAAAVWFYYLLLRGEEY